MLSLMTIAVMANERTVRAMSNYIKREDAEKAILDCPVSEMLDLINLQTAITNIDTIPSADVVEIGKAYPRGFFEEYGLTEWKDKDGRRWAMIERRNNE